MEKLRVKCCLSIRMAVLMEKRWILVGLSMERAYFVEEKEIAGRASNDGEGGRGSGCLKKCHEVCVS